MNNVVRETDYAILAETLAAARKQAGLSQNALGKRLGVGQKIISVIELGARRVDFLELLAFERALGLKPLDLARRVLAAINVAD